MLPRPLLFIPMLGFLAISVLLFVNHFGFATKFASYFFWVLLAVTIWGLISHEIKK